MVTRTIEKNLAGIEDLLIGNGEQTQSRGGTNYVLTKFRPQHVVNILADLQDVVYSKLTSVRVLAGTILGDNNGGLYNWDSASTATHNGTTVVQVTGVVTGRWLLITNTATESFEGAVILADDTEAEAGIATTVLQCKNMESAFKSILSGYNKSGTHSSYTADADGIDYNSKFAVTGNTVANLPWTTAEKGFLTTEIHTLTTNRLQKAVNIETGDTFSRTRIGLVFTAWVEPTSGQTIILDAPETILSGSPVLNNWTTINASTLVSIGAKSAVLKLNIYSNRSSGIYASANVYLRKTGSGVTPDQDTLMVHASEATVSAAALLPGAISQVTVNLDANQGFDYYCTINGDSATLYITIIGYIL